MMTSADRGATIDNLQSLARLARNLRGHDPDFDQRIGVLVRNLTRTPDARQVIGIANCPPYSGSTDIAARLTPVGWAMSVTHRPWLGGLVGGLPSSVVMWREGEVEAAIGAEAWTNPLAMCAANLLSIAADLEAGRRPSLVSP